MPTNNTTEVKQLPKLQRVKTERERRLEKALENLSATANELAQYTSYQEIIGACGNRQVIRTWCDKTYQAVREAEQALNESGE